MVPGWELLEFPSKDQNVPQIIPGLYKEYKMLKQQKEEMDLTQISASSPQEHQETPTVEKVPQKPPP